MSKKCSVFWNEAHVEVKITNILGPHHFRKLRCRKSVRRRGTVKNTRGSARFLTIRLPFDVEKVHAVWREAQLEVKRVKN